LPQGLPKKIQFQLLLPDLALQITNALARGRNIRLGIELYRHLPRPARRPQPLRAATTEMHAPFVELVRPNPQLAGKRHTTLPVIYHPFHRRELELPAEYTSLARGHFPSQKKCSLFICLTLGVHSREPIHRNREFTAIGLIVHCAFHDPASAGPQ
jgi:hypothetical protein